MGIRVVYGPAPLVAGQAALLSGMGDYQKWLQEQRAAEAARNAELALRERSMLLNAQNAEDQRQFQAEQDQWKAGAQADRDMFFADQTAQKFQAEQEAKRAADETQFNRQLQLTEKQLQQPWEKARSEEWQYTEQQKRRLNELTEYKATVLRQVARGDLSQEEGQRAVQLIEAEMAGMGKLFMPWMKQANLPENLQPGKQWKDANGNEYINGPDGKPIPLKPLKPEITAEDYARLHLQVQKAMTTKDAMGDDVPPDPADVDRRVEEILSRYESRSGRKVTQAGQEFPAPEIDLGPAAEQRAPQAPASMPALQPGEGPIWARFADEAAAQGLDGVAAQAYATEKLLAYRKAAGQSAPAILPGAQAVAQQQTPAVPPAVAARFAALLREAKAKGMSRADGEAWARRQLGL